MSNSSARHCLTDAQIVTQDHNDCGHVTILMDTQSASAYSHRASPISSHLQPLPLTPKRRHQGAQGRPVVGFGAGEPDFATPDYIVEAASKQHATPRCTANTPASTPLHSRKQSPTRHFKIQVTRSALTRFWRLTAEKQAVFRCLRLAAHPGTRPSSHPYWTTYPEVKLPRAQPRWKFSRVPIGTTRSPLTSSRSRIPLAHSFFCARLLTQQARL